MIETCSNGFKKSIRFTCDKCHASELHEDVQFELRLKLNMAVKGWDITGVFCPQCSPPKDVRTSKAKTYILKRFFQ